MRYSDYMAGMQRDDDTVATANLIAAQERGIEDLRTAAGQAAAWQATATYNPRHPARHLAKRHYGACRSMTTDSCSSS
jgi:hypothetical protein